MLRPLYSQRKSPRYPLDRRLGGPQSRSGRGGEEKNSQPLSGLESPIIQIIARRPTRPTGRKHLLVQNCVLPSQFMIYPGISYGNNTCKTTAPAATWTCAGARVSLLLPEYSDRFRHDVECLQNLNILLKPSQRLHPRHPNSRF
jgi:hypothetical protein